MSAYGSMRVGLAMPAACLLVPQLLPRRFTRRNDAMLRLLQKSFCTGDQKFCGLQARLSCKDVRDLTASC